LTLIALDEIEMNRGPIDAVIARQFARFDGLIKVNHLDPGAARPPRPQGCSTTLHPIGLKL
jgi:hypothetical protein